MNKTFTNAQMLEMLHRLQPLLAHKGVLGYAVARNTRVLRNSLVEYERFRDELIEKYGEPDLDENGAERGIFFIHPKSPKFKQFCDELAPLNNIEHGVELTCVKVKDVIDVLTGEELLNIDWMLDDSEGVV